MKITSIFTGISSLTGAAWQHKAIYCSLLPHLLDALLGRVTRLDQTCHCGSRTLTDKGTLQGLTLSCIHVLVSWENAPIVSYTVLACCARGENRVLGVFAPRQLPVLGR